MNIPQKYLHRLVDLLLPLSINTFRVIFTGDCGCCFNSTPGAAPLALSRHCASSGGVPLKTGDAGELITCFYLVPHVLPAMPSVGPED